MGALHCSEQETQKGDPTSVITADARRTCCVLGFVVGGDFGEKITQGQSYQSRAAAFEWCAGAGSWELEGAYKGGKVHEVQSLEGGAKDC